MNQSKKDETNNNQFHLEEFDTKRFIDYMRSLPYCNTVFCFCDPTGVKPMVASKINNIIEYESTIAIDLTTDLKSKGTNKEVLITYLNDIDYNKYPNIRFTVDNQRELYAIRRINDANAYFPTQIVMLDNSHISLPDDIQTSASCDNDNFAKPYYEVICQEICTKSNSRIILRMANHEPRIKKATIEKRAIYEGKIYTNPDDLYNNILLGFEKYEKNIASALALNILHSIPFEEYTIIHIE